jgi:glycerophosphoryl diester phosphodiesterase
MSFKGVFAILLVFVSSCKKQKDYYPDTKVGGHACAGLSISSSNYHDNSLEAYKYARSFDGIEMVEVDVQLSKDGTLWLFHDPELSKESTGEGFINQQNDSYLSGLRYKTLEKEPLIRLQDLPSDLKGIKLVLDLKESDGTPAGLIDSTLLIQALIQGKNYFSNGNLGLISNSYRFVPTMKGIGYSVYLNSYNFNHFSMNQVSTFSDGAVFQNAAIELSDVNSVKMIGKEVIIYDVRSPKGITSAFNKGPHYLLTDELKATLIIKYQ